MPNLYTTPEFNAPIGRYPVGILKDVYNNFILFIKNKTQNNKIC